MKQCIKLFFIIILINHTPLKAKAMLYTDSNYTPKHSFYAELLGNGFSMLSVNYEYSFNCSKHIKMGTRIGYGFKIEPFTDFFTVPVEMQFLYSKNKKHYLEMGLGLTYTEEKTKLDALKMTLIFGRIGYRYQSKNGFLFRIGATPFGQAYKLSTPNIYLDPPVILLGGISVGYSIQNKKN